MADGVASPQPAPGRNRLTKPAPTAAQTLARRLLDEDLRAGSRRRSVLDALARLLGRLRRPTSWDVGTPVHGNQQAHETSHGLPSPAGNRAAPTGGNNAPLAAAPVSEAHRMLARLSPAEVQKVMQAALELVSGNRVYQRAFEKGRLPVVEELLNRAALGDQSPSKPATPTVSDRTTSRSSEHHSGEGGRSHTAASVSAVSSPSRPDSRLRSESPDSLRTSASQEQAPSSQSQPPLEADQSMSATAYPSRATDYFDYASTDFAALQERPRSTDVTPAPSTPESLTELMSATSALYDQVPGNESWAAYGQTAGAEASVHFAQDSAHATPWPLPHPAGPEVSALSVWSEERPFSPTAGRAESFSRPRPLPSEAARQAYGFVTDNGRRVSRPDSASSPDTVSRPVSPQSNQPRRSGPAR